MAHEQTAAADMISITPEMIEFGAHAIREHRLGEGLECLVRRAYLAMETARRWPSILLDQRRPVYAEVEKGGIGQTLQAWLIRNRADIYNPIFVDAVNHAFENELRDHDNRLKSSAATLSSSLGSPPEAALTTT